MAELKIKNIPQELIDKIDCYVQQSDCPNRSKFLINALQDYCLYHDQYLIHVLPSTTRILCEDALQRDPEKYQNLLKYCVETCKASNNLMSQLCDLFETQFGENSDENSNDEEPEI